MDCIAAQKLLSCFHDNELQPELVAEFREHIGGCCKCSDELASFDKLSTLFDASVVPEPSAGLWDKLECAMTSSSISRTVPAVRRIGIRFRVLGLTLAAGLLLAMGVWGFTHRHNQNDHRHDALAVNLQATLSQFATDPLLAMDELSKEYHGVEVSLDTAESMLGYRPAIGKHLPNGYQLTSTHILKMPCCTCSASVCRRSDGSSFAIFEHNTEQQMWFGDAPAVMAKCGNKECRLVQMPEHLAVTWKSGSRQLTAIGVNGVEEVASLVAAIENPASPG